MTKTFGYTFCCALREDKCYIASVATELEDQDVEHAILFEEFSDDWERWSFDHRLAGIAAYQEDGTDKLVTVGIDGFVETVDADGADEAQIFASAGERSPSRLCALRCVRIIGDHVYAAGNARLVFRRRLSDHSWTRWDHGCALPLTSSAIASFHAIDGDESGWLVAVGLGGEVWSCDRGVWQQRNSPTDVRLEAVQSLGERRFIAAGALGTIVVGGEDGLRVIEHDATRQTFCSLASAFGRVYLCTDQGDLFQLSGTGQLTPVETGLAPSPGGGCLSYCDGRLLFCCDTAVLSFDSTHWTELRPYLDPSQA